MRILFVTPHDPCDSSFGAVQRSKLIYEAFLNTGNIIDIAYIGYATPKNKDIPNIVFWNESIKLAPSRINKLKQKYLINIFPESRLLSEKIRDIIKEREYDLIFCRYIPFASIAGLKRYSNKLLLDIDDLPINTLLRSEDDNIIKKIYLNLKSKAYIKETNWWINHCNKCFVPNKNQADDLNISYLPNISTIKKNNKLTSNNSKIILFIGVLDWIPNVVGLNFFLENCWPSIKRAVPDAEFKIAGKGLSEVLKKEWLEKYDGIELCGFVDDLNKFYEQGNIVICPIYSGGGTNIKIIEALSMTKVCILTKESRKGFEDVLKNGINCIVVNNETDFINKTIKIINDFPLQSIIATNGYKDISKEYSFNKIVEIIKKTVNEANR